MVAAPGVRPVTSPVEETDAMVGDALAHAIARPASVAPVGLRAAALSCTGAPPTIVAACGGVMATEATAVRTDAAALADFPSMVAVTDAMPSVIAVTAPPLETVTTDAFDVVQL